jgi:endogenous inhibitor of DNA gyrase (YacG/DUF329 family)
MVDLGRWVNDEYRIPGKPVPSESADVPTSPQDSIEER